MPNELLGIWRIAEHGITFLAGIASAAIMGSLAILVMIRKRIVNVDLGISEDWRDSIRQGLVFGGVIILVGYLFGSIDFEPLGGFWASQPLPVGSLVGLMTTGLLGMGRWVVAKNQAEHTETRAANAEANELTRKMLEDHMKEEERLAASAKVEVASQFERFETRTQQQIAELRELVIAALNRR